MMESIKVTIQLIKYNYFLFKWIENAYLDMTVDSLACLHMHIISEMSNAHVHTI